MGFLILGQSVGERKKNSKNKIGKGVWSLEARYLSIISEEPESNKVWLQHLVDMTLSTWRQWWKEKSTSLLESNENRENNFKSVRKNISYVSD